MNSATADAAITRWTGDAMQSRLAQALPVGAAVQAARPAGGRHVARLPRLPARNHDLSRRGRPDPRLPAGFGFDRSGNGRRLGRAEGQLPDDRRDDGACIPGRRPVRDLPGRICRAEPLDGHDRGFDQQSRGRSVDHLRSARPRRVPQLHAHAALGTAGRRPDARADDHAGDRHRRPERDQGGAALDPRGGAWRRRVEDAGRVPPRPAARAARASSPARSSAWLARSAKPRRC